VAYLGVRLLWEYTYIWRGGTLSVPTPWATTAAWLSPP